MKPNFLEIFYGPQIKRQQQVYFGGILLFLLAILMLFLPTQWFFRLGLVFIFCFLFLAFLTRLDLGLYALMAVAFFHSWEIVLGKYHWARNISYLSSVNAPLMDFIGVALGFSLLVSWLIKRHKIRFKRLRYLLAPSLIYLLFIIFAFISALGAYEHNVLTSLKYLVRNMVFVYLIYLILPNILIKNEQQIKKILKIWFWVGVIISLFGLSSLLIVTDQDWLRVIPYGIGSFAPLGYNHNLIAEALIPIIPIAGYLIIKAKQTGQINKLKTYSIGLIIILLAELLTLSRAGWISLAIQLLMAGYFFAPQLKKLISSKKQSLLPVIIAGLLIFSYMAVFLASNIVKSSNTSRWRATQIVLFYAARNPLFGYGPGMYKPILADTQDFIMDFGDPLDAHGFIQKLLSEDGLIGLVLFSLVLLYILRYVYKTQQHSHSNDKLLLRLFFISILGAIVFQLFNTSYFNAVLWLPLGMALASAGLARSKLL